MKLNVVRPQPGTVRIAAFAALALIVLTTPDAVLAQGTDGITSMAQNILDWLQGSFAKTVATIAVIIVGFMFFTGRASMQLFVTVVIGIFIVFSAGWIVDQITGGA
ncbi:MAG: TrbC/VirB2 family protein [Sphingomonas sp.]|nr:TrbC/VirB2 family protein [Sphingomonas sp.]